MTTLSRRSFARATAFGVVAAATLPSQLTARTATTSPVVRLDSNENPWGPSPAALLAIREALSASHRYPDEHEQLLTTDLARHLGVGADQILLGSGSGEILKLAALAFTGPKRSIVVATPTFEAIAGHARMSAAEVIEVPLTETYSHDLDRMRAPKAGLIYICNPNNPTASLTPRDQIRAFLTSVPRDTAVILDEAYHHYVDSDRYESAVSLTRSLPNVVVLRTFSKIYGMAGLRCGYAVAAAPTIRALRQHQPWNTPNLAALAAARASLADAVHVNTSRKRNSDTRRDVVRRLAAMGFSTIPSETNFIMVEVGRDVSPVIRALRDRQVNVGRLFPALPKHLRVTIGTPAEMNAFVAALQDAMSKPVTISATRPLEAPRWNEGRHHA